VSNQQISSPWRTKVNKFQPPRKPSVAIATQNQQSPWQPIAVALASFNQQTISMATKLHQIPFHANRNQQTIPMPTKNQKLQQFPLPTVQFE
jgi:hypothetical protein